MSSSFYKYMIMFIYFLQYLRENNKMFDFEKIMHYIPKHVGHDSYHIV